MKKMVLGVLAAVLVLIVSSYVFIPNVIELRSSAGVKATGEGLHRMLLSKESVAMWWPGKTSNDSFYLNNNLYKIENSNITLLHISINGQPTSLSTGLFLVSMMIDSTQLEWTGSMVTSYNPVKRFLRYLEAKNIRQDMNGILKSIKRFYSKPENVYGIEIQKSYVSDSFLIATSGQCKGYPTNQYIYNLIDQLRKYAIRQLAKETGYPMLNVNTLDSINFDVRVAIPIDKLLPSSGDILQKRMLGGGFILVAEVKGGVSVTLKALQQLQRFVEDYQYRAPAIPFYSLITDRSIEPDSSKWITKIYFPVK